MIVQDHSGSWLGSVLLTAAIGVGALQLTYRIAHATSAEPPIENTNSPPQFRSCSGSFFCHDSVNDPTGLVVLGLTDAATGLPFTEYLPATDYRLSFSITSGRADRQRFGFEALPLEDAADSMAGEFPPACTAGYTVRAEAGARFSVAHLPATFSTTGASWEVCWTSPLTDVGPLTFYVCGNAANGDMGSSGDFIQCTTFSIQVAPPPDTDGDGLTDPDEIVLGTDPLDQDTDDDGLSDFEEAAMWLTDPLECDTDRDGLPDGLEVGVVVPLADTDLTAGCHADDLDPASTTDPLVQDTDGDRCLDGDEDGNANGVQDGVETDPTDGTDCSGPASFLRVARTMDSPPVTAVGVFATAPCRTRDDVSICAEALAIVENVDDPVMPLTLDGVGTLVFIHYDSDTSTSGTADSIRVEKHVSLVGSITVSVQ